VNLRKEILITFCQELFCPAFSEQVSRLVNLVFRIQILLGPGPDSRIQIGPVLLHRFGSMGPKSEGVILILDFEICSYGVSSNPNPTLVPEIVKMCSKFDVSGCTIQNWRFFRAFFML
jgi:hypothetical protein